MIKKALVALAMSGTMMSAHAGYLVKEDFNDVSTLQAKGWVMTNASTPGGNTGWYQGDQTQFGSKSGPRDSYIAANYENAPEGGLIDNWLITPEFSTALGARVTFWVRSIFADNFSDSIAFGKSNGGSDLDDFSLTPTMTVGTDGWTQFRYDFDKVAGSGRFAFQYIGDYGSANYIGIDRVRISAIPEPSTMLMLGIGVMGLAAARRRKRA